MSCSVGNAMLLWIVGNCGLFLRRRVLSVVCCYVWLGVVRGLLLDVAAVDR